MSLVRSLTETSLLSDHDIKELIKDGKLYIEPYESAAINQASIDLRLGSILVQYPPQTIKIGVDRPQSREIDISNSSYVLHPGEFVLGTTKEEVYIPNGYQGVIETKGGIARAGLWVHNNDGHIDAGFRGHITLEIVNMHRDNVFIELAPDTLICQLFIGKLSSSCDSLYNGKYLNQAKPTTYYPDVPKTPNAPLLSNALSFGRTHFFSLPYFTWFHHRFSRSTKE